MKRHDRWRFFDGGDGMTNITQKILIVITILFFSIFLCLPCDVNAKGNSMIEDYETINAEYENNGNPKSTQFYYSDLLFLEDSTSFSPEIAKISVVLASSAYNLDMTKNILSEMGFDGNDGIFSYETSTYENKDTVAYSIVSKEFNYIGTDYILYCIPIRGTQGNYEWKGNFNLENNDGNHKGFYIAANLVLNKLEEKILEDNPNGKKTVIIWTMGHSRGAAVSNIISGKLTDGIIDSRYGRLVNANHVWSYNFACPAVSKSLSETQKGYSNIYNFNNIGDLIPLLPLESWGYSRYGNTIELDLNCVENFQYQFKRFTTNDYKPPRSNGSMKTALNDFIRSEERFNESDMQLLFTLISYVFNGNKNKSIGEYGDGYLVDVFGENYSNIRVEDIYRVLKEEKVTYEDYLEFLKNANCLLMSEEEFSFFLKNYSNTINKIEKVVGFNIETKSDISLAIKSISNILTNSINRGITVLVDLEGIFFDTKGQWIGDVVTYGHTQCTYVLWINSMYYGFNGWSNNTDISSVSISNKNKTIGSNCFSGCSSLNNVVIPESVSSIGASAFSYCTSLDQIDIKNDECVIGKQAFENTGFKIFEVKTKWKLGEKVLNSCNLDMIIMPVDFEYPYIHDGTYSSDMSRPFYGLNVKKVYYKKGYTGRFIDRNCTWSDNSCLISLEYTCNQSIEEIEFEEGIVHIGAYCFYSYNSSSFGNFYGKIKTIKWPTTLESIGECAFEKQVELEELAIPSTITELPRGCFSGCSGLKYIKFPSTIDKISDSCFSNCTGLENVNIPNNIKIIGNYSFSGCSSLNNVVIPESVSSIGASAFSYCTSLDQIDIKNDECVIGKQAFENTGFKIFEVKTKWKLGEKVLNSCNLDMIIMPVDFEYPYIHDGTYSSDMSRPFYGLNVKKVYYKKGYTGRFIDRNCTWSDNSCLISLEYTCNQSIEEIEFEEGIVHIGAYCFYSYNSSSFGNFYGKIKTIKWPTTLESIGECAFEKQVELEELAIPSTITELPRGCFSGCSGLKRVYIPSIVQFIDDSSFPQDNNLTIVGIRNTYAEEYANLHEYNFEPMNCIYHNWDEGVTTKEATCKEKGIITYTCQDCNLTKTENISSLSHIETNILAVKATCTNKGTTAGKKCSVCGEILEAPKEIPALGHTEETIPAVAPTCTTPGKTVGKKCSVCGEILVEQEEIEASGHTEEVIPAVEVKCTTNGCTAGKKCSTCGELLETPEEIKALGHTEETIPAVAPTCTSSGKTSGKKCSVCGEILEAQDEIEASGHTEETIPAVAPTCTTPGKTAGKKCSVCGEILEAQADVPALGHDWGDWKVTREATETEEGLEERICKIDPSHTESRTIPKKEASEKDKDEDKGGNKDKQEQSSTTPDTSQKPSDNKDNTPSNTTTTTPTDKQDDQKPSNPAKPDEGKETSAGEGVGTISSDGTILTDTNGVRYYVSAKVKAGDLKNNLKVADKKSGGKYKITKVTKKKGKVTGGTVTYMAPYNKNCTKATAGNCIKIGGVKFKITAVNANAFKGCTKLKSFTVGENITTIGKNAFKDCKNLKTFTIKSLSLKSIGANSFKGVNAKIKFKVPKKKLDRYERMIRKAGAPKTSKITK